MNAFQRFQAFPAAARAWCWLIALGIAVSVIGFIYLSTATPFTVTQGGNTVSSTAAQVSSACQDPASFTSGSMTFCRQAQNLESLRAGFAWGAVLAVLALAVLLVVFWNRTGPQAPATSGGLPAAPFGGGQAQSWYEAPTVAPATSGPGFYEDPTARYPLRYFNGRAWTSRVSANAMEKRAFDATDWAAVNRDICYGA